MSIARLMLQQFKSATVVGRQSKEPALGFLICAANWIIYTLKDILYKLTVLWLISFLFGWC